MKARPVQALRVQVINERSDRRKTLAFYVLWTLIVFLLVHTALSALGPATPVEAKKQQALVDAIVHPNNRIDAAVDAAVK